MVDGLVALTLLVNRAPVCVCVCVFKLMAELMISLISHLRMTARGFCFVVRAKRHVVRLYEVYETPDKVYIVLENCPCGDLEKMLYLRG